MKKGSRDILLYGFLCVIIFGICGFFIYQSGYGLAIGIIIGLLVSILIGLQMIYDAIKMNRSNKDD